MTPTADAPGWLYYLTRQNTAAHGYQHGTSHRHFGIGNLGGEVGTPPNTMSKLVEHQPGADINKHKARTLCFRTLIDSRHVALEGRGSKGCPKLPRNIQCCRFPWPLLALSCRHFRLLLQHLATSLDSANLHVRCCFVQRSIAHTPKFPIGRRWRS